MANATLACPKCKKTFRSSDDVKDTRIRCPLCAFEFVVREFAGDDKPPIAKVKAKPKPKSAEEDEDDVNPYDVNVIAIVPRCPNCANQMESEAAVICLYCGYNTQTRTLGKTKRVFRQSGADKAKWLMPGILCLGLIFGLMLLQNYYILGLGGQFRGEDGWLWKLLFSEPVYLWLTLMVAGVAWVVGRFVFKRLILEPTPPEEVAE